MNPYLHQIKRLSWFLLISLVVNAALFSLLVFVWFKESPEALVGESYAFYSESKQFVAEGEFKETVEGLKRLPVDELLLKLPDKHLVEHGFTVGDLALAVLSGFYRFDIERAIHRPLEKKAVLYGAKGEALLMFPGLSEEDFATLESFIKREKWPYSTEGLFLLLKHPRFQNDASLKETFYLTREFIEVERLLSTTTYKAPKEEVLKLLLSGEWGKLAAFYEIQKSSFDVSEKPRRLFLIDWVRQGSFEAAALLYRTDEEFALRKLDDTTTLKLLKLFEKDPETLKDFSYKLSKLPRSEEVKRLAQAYIPQTIPKAAPKMDAPPSIYIVQPNDSLWKIAKKLNTSIERLRQVNQLTTDSLKPGLPLKIPAGTPPPLSTTGRSAKDA